MWVPLRSCAWCTRASACNGTGSQKKGAEKVLDRQGRTERGLRHVQQEAAHVARARSMGIRDSFRIEEAWRAGTVPGPVRGARGGQRRGHGLLLLRPPLPAPPDHRPQAQPPRRARPHQVRPPRRHLTCWRCSGRCCLSACVALVTPTDVRTVQGWCRLHWHSSEQLGLRARTRVWLHRWLRPFTARVPFSKERSSPRLWDMGPCSCSMVAATLSWMIHHSGSRVSPAGTRAGRSTSGTTGSSASPRRTTAA